MRLKFSPCVDLIFVSFPQNLVEFWAVATRSSANNGLGLTTFSAQAELERLKTAFHLLNETDQIFPTWESLVVEHNVIGKPTYDARLVAAMQVHNLTAILTFDRTGFSRYPRIEVIHPEDVA